MRVAMPKVNREALGDCWLWYPNLTEQDAIIEKLSRLVAPLDLVVDRIRQQSMLVSEYRTRIIVDVVTGKFDVRHLGPIAPETAADEGESWEEEEMTDGEEADDLELIEEAADADD